MSPGQPYFHPWWCAKAHEVSYENTGAVGYSSHLERADVRTDNDYGELTGDGVVRSGGDAHAAKLILVILLVEDVPLSLPSRISFFCEVIRCALLVRSSLPL